MMYKFTARAQAALEIASELAMELGHTYIGTEHLLYGLVKEASGIASKVLENQGVTPEKIQEEIEELIGTDINSLMGEPGFTPRTKRVIENAFREAKKLKSDYIGTEHLLVGLMKEGDSIAVRILLDLEVDPRKLYNEIAKVLTEEESDIVRRGRNVQNHHLPKNANVNDYMYATAFEGLIGYLYLSRKNRKAKRNIRPFCSRIALICS